MGHSPPRQPLDLEAVQPAPGTGATGVGFRNNIFRAQPHRCRLCFPWAWLPPEVPPLAGPPARGPAFPTIYAVIPAPGACLWSQLRAHCKGGFHNPFAPTWMPHEPPCSPSMNMRIVPSLDFPVQRLRIKHTENNSCRLHLISLGTTQCGQVCPFHP